MLVLCITVGIVFVLWMGYSGWSAPLMRENEDGSWTTLRPQKKFSDLFKKQTLTKKEDEFDCFKINNMTDGNVLTFNMENFLGVVEFNGSKIYREIKLVDGILSIQDFSKLQRLQPYDSWGEKTSGIKNKFSEGYKRFS